MMGSNVALKDTSFLLNDSTKPNELWSPLQWWVIQGIFWLSLSAITFFTLTVWYATLEWPHILHTLLQGVLGLFLTWPLYRVLHATSNMEPVSRVIIGLVAVAITALVWTLMRMVTFIWMTGLSNLWADFGGWYFGAIFIFLCWAGMFYVIHYYRLLQAEHQKVLEASARSFQSEALAREAQLKMLRYQLNPHFLFNTLNAVSALVRLGDVARSREMLARLSTFLRYSLDAEPLELVPLRTEEEMLRLYLDIEKTRFDDRLNIDFDISNEASSALVPGLFLQPLVENSVKYAIESSEDGGSLSVKAYITGKTLHIEMKDTGPGMDSADLQNDRGVGLTNTRERLETLYPDNFEIAFERADENFVIHISIPYRNARQDQNNRNSTMVEEAPDARPA